MMRIWTSATIAEMNVKYAELTSSVKNAELHMTRLDMNAQLAKP